MDSEKQIQQCILLESILLKHSKKIQDYKKKHAPPAPEILNYEKNSIAANEDKKKEEVTLKEPEKLIPEEPPKIENEEKKKEPLLKEVETPKKVEPEKSTEPIEKKEEPIKEEEKKEPLLSKKENIIDKEEKVKEPSSDYLFLKKKAQEFANQIDVIADTEAKVNEKFKRIVQSFSLEQLDILKNVQYKRQVLKMKGLPLDIDSTFESNLESISSNDLWLELMDLEAIPQCYLFYFRNVQERVNWFQTEVARTTWSSCQTQHVFMIQKPSPPLTKNPPIPQVLVEVNSPLMNSSEMYKIIENQIPVIQSWQKKSEDRRKICPLYLVQFGWQSESSMDWSFLTMLHFYLCISGTRCVGDDQRKVKFLKFKNFIFQGAFFWLNLQSRSNVKTNQKLWNYLLNFIQDSSNILVAFPPVTPPPPPPPPPSIEKWVQELETLQKYRDEVNSLFQ